MSSVAPHDEAQPHVNGHTHGPSARPSLAARIARLKSPLWDEPKPAESKPAEVKPAEVLSASDEAASAAVAVAASAAREAAAAKEAAVAKEAAALEAIAGEQRAIEAASRLVSLISEQRTILEKLHEVSLSEPAAAQRVMAAEPQPALPPPPAVANEVEPDLPPPTAPPRHAAEAPAPVPPASAPPVEAMPDRIYEPSEPLSVALARLHAPKSDMTADLQAALASPEPIHIAGPDPEAIEQRPITQLPSPVTPLNLAPLPMPVPYGLSSAGAEPRVPILVPPMVPPPPTTAMMAFAAPVERPPMIIERAQAEHRAGGIDRTDEPEPSRVPAFAAGFGMAMAIGVMLYLVRVGG